jgi:hypothetical protein
MLRIPNIFIENTTHITSNKFDFNIKFDTIRGVNITEDFLDTLFYSSLSGKISSRKNGLKIIYYNEYNKIFIDPIISKFELMSYENKKIVSNKNLIKLKKDTICKYITRIEIIFTNNNNDIVIFDSKIPQNSIFSESLFSGNTKEKLKNGIALPLNEGNIEILNKFKIFYK